MRVMVALLSVLALCCGGKSKSSSGGGVPATTSYAAAGKIGSACKDPQFANQLSCKSFHPFGWG